MGQQGALGACSATIYGGQCLRLGTLPNADRPCSRDGGTIAAHNCALLAAVLDNPGTELLQHCLRHLDNALIQGADEIFGTMVAHVLEAALPRLSEVRLVVLGWTTLHVGGAAASAPGITMPGRALSTICRVERRCRPPWLLSSSV